MPKREKGVGVPETAVRTRLYTAKKAVKDNHASKRRRVKPQPSAKTCTRKPQIKVKARVFDLNLLADAIIELKGRVSALEKLMDYATKEQLFAVLERIVEVEKRLGLLENNFNRLCLRLSLHQSNTHRNLDAAKDVLSLRVGENK